MKLAVSECDESRVVTCLTVLTEATSDLSERKGSARHEQHEAHITDIGRKGTV